MPFWEIFTNFWNQAIIGFVSGLVVYIATLENRKIFGINLNTKFKRIIYAFFVTFILVLIYSAFVYFF